MRKLGCVPSRPDRRDYKLAAYVATLGDSPPARDWTKGVRFATFGNLQFGCCTCSALGHAEQTATHVNGLPSTITTEIVLKAYDAISGWNQDTPSENDNGASCRDALKWFREYGHIQAFVRLDITKFEIEYAINAGGCAYIALELPKAWQSSPAWDVAPANKFTQDYERRSWGGHAVSALAYDELGLTVATWGYEQRLTWEGLYSYCSEAWMPVMKPWVQRLTPSGFDAARLSADLAALGST